MLNIEKWGVHIGEKTVLIIFMTLIAFIFGNLTIYIFQFNNKKRMGDEYL